MDDRHRRALIGERHPASSPTAALVAAVEGAAKERVPDLKTVALIVPGNGELLPESRRSDHAAFWHCGYPAVMPTDTANF
jgi:hypothetical protein